MSEEELIKIVKKSKEPVRSMQELSKKLIGTRTGMFFYTENFRLDFDNFCWKLDYYEKENKQLHSIIKEVRELVEQYSWNTYYYQCPSSRRYFKSEIISDLKQILDKENI